MRLLPSPPVAISGMRAIFAHSIWDFNRWDLAVDAYRREDEDYSDFVRAPTRVLDRAGFAETMIGRLPYRQTGIRCQGIDHSLSRRPGAGVYVVHDGDCPKVSHARYIRHMSSLNTAFV